MIVRLRYGDFLQVSLRQQLAFLHLSVGSNSSSSRSFLTSTQTSQHSTNPCVSFTAAFCCCCRTNNISTPPMFNNAKLHNNMAHDTHKHSVHNRHASSLAAPNAADLRPHSAFNNQKQTLISRKQTVLSSSPAAAAVASFIAHQNNDQSSKHIRHFSTCRHYSRPALLLANPNKKSSTRLASLNSKHTHSSMKSSSTINSHQQQHSRSFATSTGGNNNNFNNNNYNSNWSRSRSPSSFPKNTQFNKFKPDNPSYNEFDDSNQQKRQQYNPNQQQQQQQGTFAQTQANSSAQDDFYSDYDSEDDLYLDDTSDFDSQADNSPDMSDEKFSDDDFSSDFLSGSDSDAIYAMDQTLSKPTSSKPVNPESPLPAEYRDLDSSIQDPTSVAEFVNKAVPLNHSKTVSALDRQSIHKAIAQNPNFKDEQLNAVQLQSRKFFQRISESLDVKQSTAASRREILRENKIHQLRNAFGQREGDDIALEFEEEFFDRDIPEQDDAEEAAVAAKIKRLPSIDANGRSHAHGGRKTASAHVSIEPSISEFGEYKVNYKPHSAYFERMTDQAQIVKAFRLTGTLGQFSVIAYVQGGGKSSQAAAVGLAVSKALANYFPEHRKQLKNAGYLRRDPRQVERKKFGKYKARKGYTYVRR